MIIDVGSQILKKLGYEALVARCGKEAIEIVSKAHRAKSKKGKNAMRQALCPLHLIWSSWIWSGEAHGKVSDAHLQGK